MNMRENLTIKWYTTIDSTNLQAMRERHLCADGTVWAAEFQSAGRGQRGNKWEGESAKNLAFSILFKPNNLSARKQFNISKAVSLGVRAYLSDLGVEAKIKWPNDIYAGNKKICGILIENSVDADILSSSIVGIGININQRQFSAVAANATSLSLLKHPDDSEDIVIYDLKEELKRVLRCVFYYYDELVINENGNHHKEYLNNLYRNEDYFLYEILKPDENLLPNNIVLDPEKCRGRIIEAKIVTVDDNGCLILEERGGVRGCFAFKEIRYIL